MRTDARPNVLFIMSDQHRHDYMGAAGASFLRTPNLDRLAARGVRFTRCTTNSPVCAPARIGLASGLQPVRLGALDNNAFLPFSTRTYYQRLRDSGYRVGCVGKLDLAKPASYNGRHGDRPCLYGWGFTHPEECEGKMHAGMHDEPMGPYGFRLREHGLYRAFRQDYARRAREGWSTACWDSVLPTEHFEDAYIGRRAAEWIEAVPDDFPWHYFVSFVGPHDPFDPPTEYADLYRDSPMPPPVQDAGEGKPDAVRRRMGHSRGRAGRPHPPAVLRGHATDRRPGRPHAGRAGVARDAGEHVHRLLQRPRRDARRPRPLHQERGLRGGAARAPHRGRAGHRGRARLGRPRGADRRQPHDLRTGRAAGPGGHRRALLRARAARRDRRAPRRRRDRPPPPARHPHGPLQAHRELQRLSSNSTIWRRTPTSCTTSAAERPDLVRELRGRMRARFIEGGNRR